MKYRLKVGIDPGTKTGFAIWDSKKKEYVSLETLTFWKTVRKMEGLKDAGVKVYIEVPGRFLYSRNKRGNNMKEQLNIAHKAGGTYREAMLLCDLCADLGIEYVQVSPSRSKLNSEQFQRTTGYTGRTNEHVRDAGMLVFGR